jgi:hypothetical protein
MFERSPIARLGDWTAPTLIIACGDDAEVPVEQGIALHNQLQGAARTRSPSKPSVSSPPTSSSHSEWRTVWARLRLRLRVRCARVGGSCADRVLRVRLYGGWGGSVLGQGPAPLQPLFAEQQQSGAHALS